MKRKLKICIVMFLLICTFVPFSSKIFAANYYDTYLDILENQERSGEPRNFLKGDYIISFINPGYKWFGQCTLTKDLYRKDLIGHTFLAGTTDTMNIEKTYSYNMGYYSAYKAYYYFYTQSGGMYCPDVFLYYANN